MNKTIITIVVTAVVILGGYFVFNGSSPQPFFSSLSVTGKNIVTYTDGGYSPIALKIKEGETVIFENRSSRSMWPASAFHPTHRVYSGTAINEHCPDISGAAFDACKGFLPGESWSFRFNKAGTWEYHDHLNPGAVGTIVVK